MRSNEFVMKLLQLDAKPKTLSLKKIPHYLVKTLQEGLLEACLSAYWNNSSEVDDDVK